MTNKRLYVSLISASLFSFFDTCISMHLPHANLIPPEVIYAYSFGVEFTITYGITRIVLALKKVISHE